MKEITEKNMLDWLEDARLSAAARLAALGDGDEERVQDSPEAREVCIINAIMKRVCEITAVEYFGVKDEMCDSVDSCEDCVLGLVDGGDSRNCVKHENRHPRLAVAVVKRWKEEQDELRH